MPDTIRVDFESLRAARRKYRTLVRQIEEGKRPHSDLIHPAYKLGQFLNEALYGAFSAVDASVPDAPPQDETHA